MMNEAVITGLGMAGKLSDVLRTTTSDSLIEYTKPTRVEPIVLMDEKVAGLEYAGDIMQSLVSLFSGYYLQAVALSVNVGKVDVIRLLDKLNPQRNALDNLASGIGNGISAVTSLESATAYEWKLPVPGQPIGLEAFGRPALESWGSAQNALNEDQSLDLGKDQVKLLGEVTNLSVGKMLEVNVESEGHKAVFPINVRLICNGMRSQDLVHILMVGNKATTAKERFHAWRAGQLEFMRDLVLCQDLIDAHKQTLANDQTGVYDAIRQRRKGNSLSTIFSGNPSVATASNLIVITQSTAKELERQIGGRLKDFRTREKVFKNTYGMLLVVVDPEWDHVTFYHRSLELPTDMSVKELKVSNKNKGPDVGEILKAYQLGNSPSI